MSSILMVAGEGLPFIKSGGLADVIGSLPPELVKKGHEVRVVLPLYQKIAQKYHQDFYFEKEYSVSINYHEVPVRLYSIIKNNVVFYFIEHQGYFERESMYGYDDDGERFAYFQKAVIEMLNQLNYWPQIIHCHDWHTGMIPCLCKEAHGYDERYRNIRHVYTIHNMAYQGNFGVEMLESCLGLGYHLFDNGNVRYDGGISFMKSGILYADKVTTVSPSYSQEILTPQYGEHLEMVLNMRKYDLWGIVNGIDIESWNPMTDPEIPPGVHFRHIPYRIPDTGCPAIRRKGRLAEGEFAIRNSGIAYGFWLYARSWERNSSCISIRNRMSCTGKCGKIPGGLKKEPSVFPALLPQRFLFSAHRIKRSAREPAVQPKLTAVLLPKAVCSG